MVMKYLGALNLVLVWLFLTGCPPQQSAPPAAPTAQATPPTECLALSQAQCKADAITSKTCKWLKSDLDQQFACRELRAHCTDIASEADCRAVGISTTEHCEFVSQKCEKKTAVKQPKAHCSDYDAIDPCIEGLTSQGIACLWDNLADRCVEKKQTKVPTKKCTDFETSTVCNQNADDDGNNCAWNIAQEVCEVIKTHPPDAVALGLCAQFAKDACNENSDINNEPCKWNEHTKACDKWLIPMALARKANCRDYSWGNYCNRSSDKNGVACLWNKGAHHCDATTIPPRPPRPACRNYSPTACDTSQDRAGNRCAFSKRANACITRAELEEESKQYGAFEFHSLKEWTDLVLTWNEAFLPKEVAVYNGLTWRNETDKMPNEEFERAVTEFAKKAADSKLKDATAWLNGETPTDADFLKTDNWRDDELAYFQDVDFYAEKVHVPDDSRIVVMGDFHGSLHSLIRNLWRLHAYGYLNNDFTITSPSIHFVFTGDFIDRGRYSVETLYTVLRLKLANFDQVHLVRGNHEEKAIAAKYGFEKELKEKYGTEEGEKLFNYTVATLRFLPVVFFASIGEKDARNNLHFSHGGFSYDLDRGEFTHQPGNLLNADDTVLYERISYKQHNGYNWTDFEQQDQTTINGRGFEDSTDGVVTAGLSTLGEYLATNNVRAIFRGHQDMEFGLKMLFKSEPAAAERTEAQERAEDYRNGPFHWIDVVIDKTTIENAATDGINLTNYAPVFTFTTAAEARQMLFDALGIIETAKKFEDFRLKIHEVKLPKDLKGQFKFVNLRPKEAEDDGIRATWALEGPGRCYINP